MLRVNYENLTREELVAVLERRDALARYGLRWERDSIPQDKSLNRDFVGLEIDQTLSVGEAQANGASELIVECSPHTSASFWEKMGFSILRIDRKLIGKRSLRESVDSI